VPLNKARSQQQQQSSISRSQSSCLSCTLISRVNLQALKADTDKKIKAVAVVHNETATGVTSDLAKIRETIDACGHPALFMVDGVSSIGALDFQMDKWKVDVAVTGSQKALSLPTGLAVVAVSDKVTCCGNADFHFDLYCVSSTLFEAALHVSMSQGSRCHSSRSATCSCACAAVLVDKVISYPQHMTAARFVMHVCSRQSYQVTCLHIHAGSQIST